MTGEHQTGDAIDDLRALRAGAGDLAQHLRACWPVRGQGGAPAAAPTDATYQCLTRHLVGLKLRLGRFDISRTRGVAKAEAEAWWRSYGQALVLPEVAASLSQLERAVSRLATRFEVGLEGDGSGGFVPGVPALLPPRPAVEWRPAGRGPVPEVDPADIRSLEDCAGRVATALSEHDPQPGQPRDAAPPG